MKTTTIPERTITCYGIFHTSYMLGTPLRTLEEIKLTRDDAEEAMKQIIQDNKWNKPSEYMIEPVDVKIHAWKTNVPSYQTKNILV